MVHKRITLAGALKFFFKTFLGISVGLFLISQIAFSQPKRIAYNNQQLFLSGANLAWVSFGADLGPGTVNFNQFANIFQQVHDHGGNAVRWWLHTNGVNTPQFSSDSGYVIGPGAVCLADLKKVLDLAWERKVGVNLCLWSFDMLQTSNSTTVINRNKLLLNDTNYTRRYINSSLIPMVVFLKHHPAIIDWEIFNEPEGMSTDFGWTGSNKVPMSTIQRFVNLCAGAIHRADPSALVTNGSWSFKALSDVTYPLASIKKEKSLSSLDAAEKDALAAQFNARNRTSMTTAQVMDYFEKISLTTNTNYYSDSRLISAGGDPNGTLDFYSVHYYSTIDPSNPNGISPFHHIAVS